MSELMQSKRFENLDLNDPFFDSLKADYAEFEEWFSRKAKQEAYVMYKNGFIQGFLYLKVENGPIESFEPVLKGKRILKIGTLKINPHGTRLGERFIKKALDHAIVQKVESCYVTVFEKHKALVELLTKYGFERYGIKTSHNGEELVLVKDLKSMKNDELHDYPLIQFHNTKKYLLAIYPEYHTKLFPDSILRNESFDILEDVSHTNSIHKIYVCGMNVDVARRGDIMVIYRTGDRQAPAEYRAVATSICVVEEVKSKGEFNDFEDFYQYANTYSVFDKERLRVWYGRRRCFTIKMTYNAPLTRRLIRRDLADGVGLDRAERWSCLNISDEQFEKIVELGEVNEGIIVY